MQPDLPWNVAGIPPEAREAARAAARREGLSVGEWLTRRILRGLADGGEDASWSRPQTSERRSAAVEPAQNRDTEDMLARVSRSESETHNAYRRIEEQLRGLSRRVEAAERSQSENSRAMNKAASEISIAAREQVQAFEQLGAHVEGLGDRVERVERETTSDGVKDAVKGLHAGLSRLADQLVDTANQSTGQIAALAGTVEAVADKVHDTHHEAESRLSALTAHIGGMDARMRAAETTLQATAQRLDRIVADFDAALSAQNGEREDGQRQALAQLSEALDKLAMRITTSEAQTAGAMARLEENIAKVESRQGDGAVERRLQGIEHVLSDIAGRLESTERNAVGATRTVEDSLRTLASRLEAAEKRYREAPAEPRAAPPPAAPVEPPPMESQFDLPPFPGTGFDHAAPPLSAPPFPAGEPLSEMPPPAGHAASFAAEMPFAAEPAIQHPAASGADSFIAAARRSALAAADAQSASTIGGFTWGQAQTAGTEPAEPKSGAMRFVLVAGIVVIAVCAVVAGIFLSHGLVGNLSTPTTPSVPPTHSETPRAAVPVPAAALPAAPAAAETAPGSPAIPLRRAAHPQAAHLDVAPVLAPHPVQPQQQAALPQAPATPAQTAAPASALDRLTTLATAGSAKAELIVGLKYLDGDGVAVNEAEAAKWLERAANQGEAIAAYRLGTLYERGHGVPADTAKAMQWYATAAKLGNRKAMHNLAVAYAEGSGTQKDLAQAAQWFLKAASLGLADSQFNLAVLYERGMGVQQSLIDAYKWYAIAAAQGDAGSKARLDAIATQLGPDERAAAQKAAADFQPQPLDRNANLPPDPSTIH